MASAASALAQQAPGSADAEPSTAAPPQTQQRRIEEIIVTAQKREQAEIDVPVAMSVLDERFLGEQAIADLRDVAHYVPNVNIRTSAVLPDIRIRGFGTSPVNALFEQSVGLNVDGIPYTRKAYFQSALYDLERIEVLRGPQGTLFGKNTTAGLLNVVTKNPSDEYTGVIDGQLGDYGFRRVEAGIGGPVVKGFFNFRAAGLIDERDGYLENTTARIVPAAPNDLLGHDRKAFRLKGEFPTLFGTDLKLTYERIVLDLTGGSEFKRIPESTRAFFRQFDPNTDFTPGNLEGSIDHPDLSRNDIDTFVANWETAVAGWAFAVDAGYSLLHDLIVNDTDFGPSPGAFIRSTRDNGQTTVEARVSSPDLAGFFGIDTLLGRALGKKTSFTTGFFYQRRRVKNFAETLTINDLPSIEFTATQDVPGGIPFPPGMPPPILDATQERTTQFFDETATAVAGFGQAAWQLLDRWTLECGLRLSSETIDAATSRVFDTADQLVLTQVLAWKEFNRPDLSHSELQVIPKVSLNYKPSDDWSFFVRWAKGVKSGGFNAFASGGTDAELNYGPEKVTEWAIDMKARPFGETAALNVSLFRMEVTDLQVLTAAPPGITVRVKNAAEARAQGFEGDFTWWPTSWLSFRDALGFNDGTFLKYRIGTCPQDMAVTGGCDLSGRPLPWSPRWTNALTTGLLLPLRALPGVASDLPAAVGGVALIPSLTVEYVDAQFLLDDLDPRKRQSSFVRLRGTFGVANAAQGWSLRLNVENLTDRRTAVLINEIPTGPGHFVQIPDAPRLFSVQLRYQF